MAGAGGKAKPRLRGGVAGAQRVRRVLPAGATLLVCSVDDEATVPSDGRRSTSWRLAGCSVEATGRGRARRRGHAPRLTALGTGRRGREWAGPSRSRLPLAPRPEPEAARDPGTRTLGHLRPQGYCEKPEIRVGCTPPRPQHRPFKFPFRGFRGLCTPAAAATRLMSSTEATIILLGASAGSGPCRTVTGRRHRAGAGTAVTMAASLSFV